MIASSPNTRRKRRIEAKVIALVRQQVAERDGYCRLAGKGCGPCQGVSEWCHFGDFKRFNTRKMDPEQRHLTWGSFMACTRHHLMYDRNECGLEATSELGCNGPLHVTDHGRLIFQEPAGRGVPDAR